MLFDTEKTAHVLGYLLWKAGGEMSFLKLLHLVYLADRQSLLTDGDTLSGDSYSVMGFEPIPHRTYSGVKFNNLSNQFKSYNHSVNLLVEVSKDDPLSVFDSLSGSDKSILDEIWNSYGAFGAFQLRKMAHKICHEWEKCKSYVIRLADILKTEGYAPERIHSVLENIAELDKLQEFSRSMQ